MSDIVGHAYDKQTGEISAERYSATNLELALEMLPPGAGWIEGAHDHMRVRVDVASGRVVRFEHPGLAERDRAEQVRWAKAQMQMLDAQAQRAYREWALYGTQAARERIARAELQCARLAAVINPGPEADQRIALALQIVAEFNQPAQEP